jgi:virulence-associated protein VagC
MALDYPVHFTLEDGVHVQVNEKGDDVYDFILQPEEGPARHFTLDNKIPNEDHINSLDFDQLNAVRRFWLEKETDG